MKLKNKKTGEIGEIILKHLSDYNQLEVITDNKLYVVKTLAELNEEWEDYEEPKDHWHIGCGGDVFIDNTESNLKIYFSIDNDFNSREEAKKAVEKLKAWKRLEDKGFKFSEWEEGTKDYKVIITGILPKGLLDDEQDNDDLDLLFGGEE